MSQYAQAIGYIENDIVWETDKIPPRFRDKDTEYTIHSEELLIEVIDVELLNSEIIVETIVIYSFHNPCLGTGNHDEERSCMSQLLKKAEEWDDLYEINTIICFTESFGSISRNSRNTNFDRSHQIPDSYFEECETIPFKLDSSKKSRQRFKDKVIKQTLPDVENREKEKLKNDIINTVDKLMNPAVCDVRENHMYNGENRISSLTFHPKVRDKICQLLRELVNDSFKLAVRDKFIAELNTAEVNDSIIHLNSLNLSYFRIYRIDEPCSSSSFSFCPRP